MPYTVILLLYLAICLCTSCINQKVFDNTGHNRATTLFKMSFNERLSGWHIEAKHAGVWLKRGGVRRGGRCLLYKQLIKALVDSTLPGATSLHVSAPFKLVFIYGPKGPKVIFDSYKALVQGQISAHGTLGMGGGGVARV